MRTLSVPPATPAVALLREVKADLHRGSVLLKDTPVDNNDFVIELACALGVPQAEQGPMAEDRVVARIERAAEALKDRYGRPVLSTTDAAFPHHTDGADASQPFDVILLQCVTPSDLGGDSTLVALDDLLEHLDEETQRLLGTPDWPFPCGRAAILSTEKGRPVLRYNRAYIESAAGEVEGGLTAEQHRALEIFDALVESPGMGRTIKLQRGECLVVNNKTVLHGRTAFSGQGERLLKRLRLRFPADADPQTMTVS